MPPVPARKIISNPDYTVDRQNPHSEEMPLAGAGEPASERERRWNMEIPDRRGIINPKAAHDHDAQREEVQPVRGTNDKRVMVFAGGFLHRIRDLNRDDTPGTAHNSVPWPHPRLSSSYGPS